MKYYTKLLFGGAAYVGGVSYILKDSSEQYYIKKNQEIENLRLKVYKAKVNQNKRIYFYLFTILFSFNEIIILFYFILKG